jgi:hypothetical protein
MSTEIIEDSDAKKWADKFKPENRQTVTASDLVEMLKKESKFFTVTAVMYDKSVVRIKLGRNGCDFYGATVLADRHDIVRYAHG